MKNLSKIISYYTAIYFRQAYSWLTPLLFFVIVVALFPLAMGPDSALLTKIAPGIIWIAALLAVVLSIDQIFQQDAHAGTLDLLFFSPFPLTVIVWCKLISHWLTHCLPLVLISPVLGFLLHFSAYEEYALIISLLLGTPVFILLGALGAALVVGIRGHGLLLPVLIMPLYIPVLIFGTATLIAAMNAAPLGGYFALMGAFFLLSAAFAPLLTSIALRIGANQ